MRGSFSLQFDLMFCFLMGFAPATSPPFHGVSGSSKRSLGLAWLSSSKFEVADPKWIVVGPSWMHVEILDDFRAEVRAKLGVFGPSWAQVGPNLWVLGPSWGQARAELALKQSM